jgi:hypothetical protein
MQLARRGSQWSFGHFSRGSNFDAHGDSFHVVRAAHRSGTHDVLNIVCKAPWPPRSSAHTLRWDGPQLVWCFLPSSPPAEKAAARQDQAGEACARDGGRNHFPTERKRRVERWELRAANDVLAYP